jgi:hypothetical protein
MTAWVPVAGDMLANLKLLGARLSTGYLEVLTATNGVDAVHTAPRRDRYHHDRGGEGLRSSASLNWPQPALDGQPKVAHFLGRGAFWIGLGHALAGACGFEEAGPCGDVGP